MKKLTVYRVRVNDEITYIHDRRKDAEDYVRGRGPGGVLPIETIQMTPQEFAALPEA